jgi:Sec7-like guanine-nucleotide exchange factor
MTASFGEDEYFARAIDKIHAAAKDRHGPLKGTCAFIRPKIKSSHEDMTPCDRANLLLHPLKLACETKDDSMVSLAIDCLEKLLAHGFATSDMPYQPPNITGLESRKSFFGGKQPEAAASTAAAGAAPRSPKSGSSDHSDLLMGQIVTTVCNCANNNEDIQLQVIRALLTSVSTPSCALHGKLLLTAIKTIYNIFLQTKSVPTQTTAKASLSQIVGIAFSRWEVEVSARVEKESESARADSRSEGGEEGAAPPKQNNSAEELTFSDTESDEGTSAHKKFRTINERDCYLIFSSLCSLSVKSDDVVAVDAPEMKSKLLSLGLLQNIFVNSADGIVKTPVFSELLRNKFWKSLLQNCANPLQEVARASFRIFTQLALNLRPHLKAEIAVFFYNVIFPLLESQNTSFVQKQLVIRTLQALGDDSQLLADLYVNFDCAIGAKPLYENLINKLSKAVQTSWIAPNWITPEQDLELKQSGLRVMSTFVRFMTTWYKKRLPPSGESAAVSQSPSGTEGNESVDFGSSPNGLSKSASLVVDSDFEKLRSSKKEYEAVVMAFNEKPKVGIQLAIQRGLLKSTAPVEIAQFLETPGLNKLVIGEYLAKQEQKDVLTAFIKMHPFSGLVIDEAMRMFLGKFKIVGEAQVVDRTMETFAEHYCAENPEAFSSAGTCYVLAFSIMMLNTDAHSVNIKPENKMDVAGFLRNNRGIDDGKDLPPAFLEEIYWRIKNNEIKLQGDSNVPTATTTRAVEQAPDSIFLSQRKKKEMDCRLESVSIAKASLGMVGDTGAMVPYTPATSIGVATAMWEVSWIATLAAFSRPLEESEDQELTDICLEGFAMATHLCCITNSATERAAFLSSLTAFTHLSSLREIDYKNVKSIMVLLTIANKEANALQTSWYDVLKCVSLLDRLHLVGSRSDVVVGRERALSARSAELKKVEQHNAEMIQRNVDQTVVEKIFANSGELSGEAIVYMIEALCRLSSEEMGESTLRAYSLQKLVEVTEQNVGRMRYVWSQMWHHLSAHFTNVCLSKNKKVAMFATDSLRQLAVKFLDRDELGNFNFQRDFLKPFDTIATQSRQQEIKELVIASIHQMVLLRARNILSGWKVVLSTLSRFTRETHAVTLAAAFEVLEVIIRSNIFHLASRDLFAELLATVSRFAENTCSVEIAKKSVDFLRLLSQFLVHGVPAAGSPIFTSKSGASHSDAHNPVPENGSTVGDRRSLDGVHHSRQHSLQSLIPGPDDNVIRLSDSDTQDMNLWLCLFAGLSSLASASIADVAMESIDTHFEILRENHHLFSASDVRLIIAGTVHPIIENTLVNLNLLNGGPADESMERVINQAALVVRRTFSHYLRVLEECGPKLSGMRAEVTNAVLSCYRCPYRRVAKIGDETLRALIVEGPRENGDATGPLFRFEDKEFSTFGNRLRPLVDVLTSADEPHPPLTLALVASFCADLVNAAETMETKTARQFLDIIKVIINYAQLRLDCSCFPAAAPTQPQDRPGLYDLQLAAYEAGFRTLFCIGDDTLFSEWGSDVLRRHKQASSVDNGERSEAAILAKVCGNFLGALTELDGNLFVMICTTAYGLLCEAIACCDPVICVPLAAVMRRYGELKLGVKKSPSKAASSREDVVAVEGDL